MKQKTFVFDDIEVDYIVISKNITKDTIKDFDVYFRGRYLSPVLDVLRHFNQKTIQYPSFIDKLITSHSVCHREALRYSRIRMNEKPRNITRYRNDMLNWLVKEYGGDWGLLNWNDYKRKQRKENKKKTSD